jgi:hypothetical protein
MAAAALGWESLPVEIRYFDGGERIKSGPLYPKKIGLGNQELDEMAGKIHGGVRQVLKDKGYKSLGSGIDKEAWLEPETGQVLVIFGYRKDVSGFSVDQKMFIDWINYCNKNKKNPHLPRFSGFESFEFRSKRYIQARMEPLNKVSRKLATALIFLKDFVESGDKVGIRRAQEIAKQMENNNIDYYDLNEKGKVVWKYFKAAEVINELGGNKQAASLMTTIARVKKFGENHGFRLDLHGGNYMQRPDGTIIVNDPFVIWLKSNPLSSGIGEIETIGRGVY